MRTEPIILRHLSGYDSKYAPFYRQYTAHKVVVFYDMAMTEKGHHKSRAVVYFFPRFSRLKDSGGKTVSFSNVGFQPGDRMILSRNEAYSWTVTKISCYRTGSGQAEHYRLECVQ